VRSFNAFWEEPFVLLLNLFVPVRDSGVAEQDTRELIMEEKEKDKKTLKGEKI